MFHHLSYKILNISRTHKPNTINWFLGITSYPHIERGHILIPPSIFKIGHIIALHSLLYMQFSTHHIHIITVSVAHALPFLDFTCTLILLSKLIIWHTTTSHPPICFYINVFCLQASQIRTISCTFVHFGTHSRVDWKLNWQKFDKIFATNFVRKL